MFPHLQQSLQTTETAMHHVITSIQEAVKNGKLILSFPRYWWSFW